MSNNEWKVATVEQCKKLVELGVVLETEKVWHHVAGLLCSNFTPWMVETNIVIPAPDVAELGKVLKEEELETMWHNTTCVITGVQNAYSIEFLGETEAQARCAALIWLIEKGYLKTEDICV